MLPTDLTSGRLYVRPPGTLTIKSIAAETSAAVNATLELRPLTKLDAAAAAGSGFVTYAVAASGYGRVRVRILLSDGSVATVHYFVLPPLAQQVIRMCACICIRVCTVLPPLTSPLRCRSYACVHVYAYVYAYAYVQCSPHSPSR